MQDDSPTPRGPLVHFIDVWERVSAKTGQTYYSGFLGNVKLVGFRETLADRDQQIVRFYIQPTDKAPPEVKRKSKGVAAGRSGGDPAPFAARADFARPANGIRESRPGPNDDLDFAPGKHE